MSIISELSYCLASATQNFIALFQTKQNLFLIRCTRTRCFRLQTLGFVSIRTLQIKSLKKKTFQNKVFFFLNDISSSSCQRDAHHPFEALVSI